MTKIDPSPQPPLEVQHVSQLSGNQGIHFMSFHVTLLGPPPVSNFLNTFIPIQILVFILEKIRENLIKDQDIEMILKYLIKKNRIQSVNLRSN